MAIEFYLLEAPMTEAAATEEMKIVRLFGIDIYVAVTGRRRKRRGNPKLIDFFGDRRAHNHPNNNIVVRGRERGGERQEPNDGPWKIQKKLFSADVGANWGHLHLPKADVKAHILPWMDAERAKRLESDAGMASLEVRVVDEDTGVVYDSMKLTHYSSTNGYVLNGAWNRICKDRGLEEEDRIGLYWDYHSQELHFSIRERAGHR